MLANILLHLLLEDEIRVEEQSVPSSKAASGGYRNSVKLEKGATIFFPHGLHSLVTWWLHFRWTRAGFPRLCQIEYLRGVLTKTSPCEYPTKNGKFCFYGMKTSLSLYPRLDHCAHCPSKHIPPFDMNCCFVVCALCIQVSIFFLCRRSGHKVLVSSNLS